MSVLAAVHKGRLFPIRLPLVAWSLSLGLLLVACNDDEPGAQQPDAAVDALAPDPDGPTPDAGAPDTAAPDTAAPDAGRSLACQAQDTKVQAALDAVRRAPHTVITVRNAACGTTVYLGGDPKKATTDSLWRVGSVTKTYVAATILTLVRDKKLALDDPLSKWVPDVPKTDGVTIKMLLDHTSGIFNHSDDPALTKDPLKEWTPDEIVALATSHEPYFAPGEGWHYANTNYTLLGMIIEEATGKKAAAAIRERVLEPAGLEQTFLEGSEPLVGTRGPGYLQQGLQVDGLYSMSSAWTAGGMVATGADLCDWIYTLFATDKVLTAAERKTMVDEAVESPDGAKYGLGMMLLEPGMTMGAGPAMMHFGSAPGYRAQAAWFPDEQLAVCSVENQDLHVGRYLSWPVRVALNALLGDDSLMIDGTLQTAGTGKPGSGGALAGATVCPHAGGKKSAQCSETSINGSFAFTASLDAQSGLFFDKPGYERIFLPLLVTKPASIWVGRLFDDARAASEYVGAGGSYPPKETGHLITVAVAGSGSTFSLTPASGVGPVYADSTWQLDPSLKASTSGELAMFLDLPPGKYELVVNSTKSCKLSSFGYGWPTSPPKPTASEIEIHAGYSTLVPFFCE